MLNKRAIPVKDLLDRQEVIKILKREKFQCDCSYERTKRDWGSKGLIHHRHCGTRTNNLLDKIIKKVERLWFPMFPHNSLLASNYGWEN